MDVFSKQLETTFKALEESHAKEINKSLLEGYEKGYECGVFESQDEVLSLQEESTQLKITLKRSHEQVYDLEALEIPLYQKKLKLAHQAIYDLSKSHYDKDEILANRREELFLNQEDDDDEEEEENTHKKFQEKFQEKIQKIDNIRQTHDCCLDHFLMDQEEVFTRNLNNQEDMGIHLGNKIFFKGKSYSLNQFANLNLVDYCRVNGWDYVFVKDLSSRKEIILNNLPNENGILRRFT